nr:hypothetical protein CFP56_07623 [Quercus suber]
MPFPYASYPTYHCCPAFFSPRRVYWKTNTLEISSRYTPDWKKTFPDWRTTVWRFLLPKTRQGRSSPAGLSSLPYELLASIFRRLCGFEIASVRLVCTDWEYVSRPFFAQQFGQKILSLVSGPQLRFTQRLVVKFGPYIKTIFISSDRYTVLGLKLAVRNYRTYCRCKDYGPPHTAYLSLSAKGGSKSESCIYWKYCSHTRALRYLIAWLGYSFSQSWLRMTGRDVQLLSAIAAQLPATAEIHIVNLLYDGAELDNNARVYGRAAPSFAYESALFNAQNLAMCQSASITTDVKYEMYLRNLVLNFPSIDEGDD